MRTEIPGRPSFLRRVKSFPLQAACKHTEQACSWWVRSIRGRVGRPRTLPPRLRVCGSLSEGLGAGRVEKEQSLPGLGLPLPCPLHSSPLLSPGGGGRQRVVVSVSCGNIFPAHLLHKRGRRVGRRGRPKLLTRDSQLRGASLCWAPTLFPPSGTLGPSHT